MKTIFINAFLFFFFLSHIVVTFLALVWTMQSISYNFLSYSLFVKHGSFLFHSSHFFTPFWNLFIFI